MQQRSVLISALVLLCLTALLTPSSSSLKEEPLSPREIALVPGERVPGPVAESRDREEVVRQSPEVIAAEPNYEAISIGGSQVIATNHAQQFELAFDEDGLSVQSSDDGIEPWDWGLRLASYGYKGRAETASASSPVATGEKVEYERTAANGVSFTEWYVNSTRGVEQGFTIPSPLSQNAPGSRDRLIFEFEVQGDLSGLLENDKVSFRTSGRRAALEYSDLHVFDAEGRTVPAEMELEGDRLALVIDDARAEYPLTIDPLIASDYKVTADVTIDRYIGETVAVHGDIAVVSAFRSHVAHVYARYGTRWAKEAILPRGGDVAVSGDTIVVGGYNFRGPLVFRRVGASWSLEGELTLAGGRIGSDSKRVAIDGDTIVVGDPGFVVMPEQDHWGAAFVFERSGTTWAQVARLAPSDGGDHDRFGSSVAINGSNLLVAAPRYDGPGTNSGAAYVFERPIGGWSGVATEEARLVPSDLAGEDGFGQAIALDGTTAFVSSPGVLGIGKVYAFEAPATGWSASVNESAMLSASVPTNFERFGSSLATTSTGVAVGARRELDEGAVYLFERPTAGWSGQRIEDSILRPSQVAIGDWFGASIAITSDTMIVGSPRDDNEGTNRGGAYMFCFAAQNWTLEDKLKVNNAAAGDRFGRSVALGNVGLRPVLVVGAPDHHGAAHLSGAAYIHRDGFRWYQAAKLVGSDLAAADRFGFACATEGINVAVGAPSWTHGGQGAAYVFQREGASEGILHSWIERAKLVAGDGANGDRFGYSIAMSERIVVVGAPYHDSLADASGAAYVFEDTSTAGDWSAYESAKLVAMDSGLTSFVGSSVDIHGDTIVLGAPKHDLHNEIGAAFVFVRPSGGWTGTVTESAQLIPSDGVRGDEFGSSVVITDEVIVVGAPAWSSSGPGAAYSFEVPGAGWAGSLEETSKIVAADGAPNDMFGYEVETFNDLLVVSAPANSGSAYLFEFDGTTWIEQAKLVAANTAASQGFGSSLAAGTGRIVAGSPSDDHAGADSGAVYSFEFVGLTTSGDDVVVTDTNETVEMRFDTVTEAGVTTFQPSSAPPAPSNFQLGNPPISYNIETTSQFTGAIQLCFDYSGTNLVAPRLFHYTSGEWVDITDEGASDPVSQIVCGSTTSLSPFAVFELSVAAQLRTLRDDVQTASVPYGVERSLVATLDSTIKALSKSHFLPARRKLENFIHLVNAHEGSRIPSSTAGQWVQAAESAIAATQSL